MNNNTGSITCSFSMDRETYNAFKSVVSMNGENVKGNIVRYMQTVIQYETPNAETIKAIEEVKKLKANPHKKTYGSFAEIMRDIDNG